MRLRLLIAGVVLPLVLWASMPLVSSGASTGQSAATLQNKITKKQSELAKKKGTESVLTTTVQKYSRQVNKLQAEINVLRRQQDNIQGDLNAKRAELVSIQGNLRKEVRRLSKLRVKLADGRKTIENRLIELYQTDPPDLVSVVLNAKGFADLLEQGEFLKNIQDQDRRLFTLYGNAKKDADATAARLTKLEDRQQKVTARVLARRNQVDQVRTKLVSKQTPIRKARAAKAAVLRKVRSDRQHIEEDLATLEKANAEAQAQLGNVPAQAVKGGNGPWDWPVNGPITGVFGETRPGHIHAGIDIAVPIGTPIRAVANGRAVLVGVVSGYGNYTCLQHTATLTSCYAHQRNFAVQKGQTVTKNQIIGYVGMTGNTTGPHLHFEARINGTPVNPMNYL